MNKFIDYLKASLSGIYIPELRLADVLEILLIAVVIYLGIMWLKNTRASTLIRGIIVLICFLVAAAIFQMSAILWITGKLGSVALLAVVILFQAEIRKGLESLGHRPFRRFFQSGSNQNFLFSDSTYNGIIRACQVMADNKIGALIVIEREVKLGEYIATGINMDAIVSEQLLLNIFEKNTALHDGAVIIRGNRIQAATCYLPLSDNQTISKSLGTRHRAAVGISELSDSFTIVVSEETGKISFAREGHIIPANSVNDLRERLRDVQTGRVRDSIRNLRFRSGREEVKENETEESVQ